MSSSHLPETLLILGCGYVGKKLAKVCIAQGTKVKATVRNQEQALSLQTMGVDTLCLSDPALAPTEWLSDCQALIDSIPLSYDSERRPYQTQSRWVDALLNNMPLLTWAGYLSSTGVYADSKGEWINETNRQFSDSPRGQARLQAEQAWQESRIRAEVFRLAGIYGDDRNILSKLQAGNYQTIHWNTPHYSNRIHVDDIITTLLTAMNKPIAGRILNVADDYPCSHEEYASTLAHAIGAPSPVVIDEQDAATTLSPAYLSFFQDNKRISNQKLHRELLSELKYPSFRDAIPHLKM